MRRGCTRAAGANVVLVVMHVLYSAQPGDGAPELTAIARDAWAQQTDRWHCNLYIDRLGDPLCRALNGDLRRRPSADSADRGYRRAVLQRVELFADGSRTHGKRHEADIQSGSQCRREGQQCVGQLTTVLYCATADERPVLFGPADSNRPRPCENPLTGPKRSV